MSLLPVCKRVSLHYAANIAPSGIQPVVAVDAIETTRFHSVTMAIVGKFFDEYTIEIGLPPNAVQFSTGYLYQNGVELKIISDCHIQMTFNDVLYNVRCPLHQRKFEPVEKNNKIKVTPFTALTGA